MPPPLTASPPLTIKRRSSLLAPLADFVILTAAMLLAVQTRVLIPIGSTLPEDYQPQPVTLLVLLAGVVALIYVGSLLGAGTPRTPSNERPAERLLITALIVFVAIPIILPAIDVLQAVYFLAASGLLCAAVILLPRRVYVGHRGHDISRDMVRLWQNRALVRLWVSHNIRSRYTQAILGILWIVLLPLMMALVLSFAFTQFLHVKFDVPTVCFFLSGLVPYNLFSNDIANSTGSILTKLGIVTQVYFPREILVLITLGEGLVDFSFTFAAMILINAAYGILPNGYYVLLPFLLLMLVILTLGFMLLVSSMSVLVRDVPQLVAVGLQLLFYLTPIIYPVSNLPPQLRIVFVINPLASIVQAFRDIVLYARAPNIITLYYPLVLSGVVLYLGYCIFKSIEGTMADLL